MQALLVFTALLLAVIAPARAIEAQVLETGMSSLPLGPRMAYRHDPAGNDSATQAFARARNGEFSGVPGGNASFGFQTGAYWFYLPVVNLHRDEPHWLLVQEYALSDQVDLYVRYPDGRMEHQPGGDHVPFGMRLSATGSQLH